MQTNGTLITAVKGILSSLLVSVAFLAQAQPNYQFSNPSLESGSALQAGAIYRFPNVKTGFDALVTISTVMPGITLTNIDRTIDGFQEAFQPQYTINGSTNAYAEFTISFVSAGTSNVVLQPNMDASGLDIDGQVGKTGGKLYEFNRIDMGGGVVDFDLLGGQLVVSNQGTAFTATNSTGVLFGASVDTAAYEVMFTVMSHNVGSFTYRVGSNNTTTSNSTRYASMYFMRFAYQNSILAAPALKDFKGVKRNNTVDLNFTLTQINDVRSVVIEKASNPSAFGSVGIVWTSNEMNKSSFTFTDNNFSTTSYYRLKMVTVSGAVQYSNVLVIRAGEAVNNNFKVYPSVISSTATVSVSATKNQQATLQLIDLNGRMVSSQTMQLQQGSNNLSISKPGNITSGNYIAVIKVDDSLQSQKIMIQ